MNLVPTLRRVNLTGIGYSPKAQYQFTCEVCGQLGVGQRNAKVHGGKCRQEQQRRTDKKNREKRQRMKGKVVVSE